MPPSLTGNEYTGGIDIDTPSIVPSSDVGDVGEAESCDSLEHSAFRLHRASDTSIELEEFFLPTETVSVQHDGRGFLARGAANKTPGIQSDTQYDENHAASVHSGRSKTQTGLSRRERSPEEPLFTLNCVFGGSRSRDERFLTPDVRHLIRNYAENVLPMLSHVGYVDTPWARFHLPRALQCFSELEIFGHSPKSRQALLHTTLCVSAYNQYNTCLSRGQDEQVHKWLSIAASYKGRALRTLETCLRGSSSAMDRGNGDSDFDEIFGAMLAMVTMDVSLSSSAFSR